MVLLILKTHRALHFRGRINKSPQRIARQRVVVPAGIHVVKFPRFVVRALRVRTVEEEPFNFVRRVQRVPFVFV